MPDACPTHARRMHDACWSTAELCESDQFAAFVDPGKGMAFVADESRQLAHRDSEDACRARNVVTPRDDHIECLGQQRGIILILVTNG